MIFFRKPEPLFGIMLSAGANWKIRQIRFRTLDSEICFSHGGYQPYFHGLFAIGGTPIDEWFTKIGT
jgi:hypothetical protein